MNGLLTFNDGAGTVIENGTIITQSLSLNNILATLPTSVVNLWSNFTTGDVNIADSLTNGVLNLGNQCTVFINRNGTTQSTLISPNVQPGALCVLGSSVNTNVVGAVEIIGTQINSRINTDNLKIGNLLTTGVVEIANAVISVVVGSFTFLGQSIQNGTSGTYNFFTNVTGSSTVNFFSNMPSGTLNIGKGGNINICQSTSGSLIKIDQNGLDNQVLISTQQSGTGVVTIGNQGVTKLLGTTTTVGGTTVNVGNQNAGLNNTTVNIGTIGLTTGGNYVNIGTQNTATTINGGLGFLCSTKAGGYTYPAYVSLQTGGVDTVMNFRGASSSLNNTYETQIKSYNGGAPYDANGKGLQQMFSGQQEFLYNADIKPRDLGQYYAIGLGYWSGSGTGAENSATISGYAPYGGVRFGGAGVSNGYFGNSWRESMVTYPGYGTRFKNGGIAFDKGNLGFIDQGWFMQTGSYGFVNTTINGNSFTTVAVTWTSPFRNAVYPMVQMFANGTGGNTDALIPTVISNSVSGFTCIVKNAQGGSTGGNLWGFYYMGIGTY
jgi:hypothetical protein